MKSLKLFKKLAVFSLLSLVCCLVSGCFDFNYLDELVIIDTVAVSPEGDVALCLNKEGESFGMENDTEIYTTNLEGGYFKRITENEAVNCSTFWSNNSKYLLYGEQKNDDLWTLNSYSKTDGQSVVLLQEMYKIALPQFSHNTDYIAYMVFPDEGSFSGSLNIYEMDTLSVYALMDNAYCSYLWIGDTKKIAVVGIVEELEDLYKGILIIKDAETLSEDVIFSGYFLKYSNSINITEDGKTLIFYASEKESKKMDIYLYDMKSGNISKWIGPEGYEFRLAKAPGLAGYILAHVKEHEEKWAGQLYLISLDKQITRVPGWPVWIREKNILYIDSSEGSIFTKNLDEDKSVNLIARFKEYYDKETE